MLNNISNFYTDVYMYIFFTPKDAILQWFYNFMILPLAMQTCVLFHDFFFKCKMLSQGTSEPSLSSQHIMCFI